MKYLTHMLFLRSFIAIYEGYMTVATSDYYNFVITHDDGIRLYVSGNLVYDGWSSWSSVEAFTNIYMDSAAYYPIRVEFFQWQGPSALIMQ